MSNGSPSATYRGYRRQALYNLWRILTDPQAAERIYKPEGAEDLYVHSLDDSLVEAVQVKDLSSPLTFSSFEPNEQKCFFFRVHQRLVSNPGAHNRLVSFGLIGPELHGAFTSSGLARSQPAEKLVAYSEKAKQKHAGTFRALSAAEAETVLGSIIVENVTEPTLKDVLVNFLRETVSGLSPETTLELLMWWIFVASEQSLPITRSLLIQKITQIGSALASLQSHHQEWQRSIFQLTEMVVSESEREILEASFSHGAQATWKHILVGVDVPRDSQIVQIEEKFRLSNVVILHGASGQGKTTLAYRFLQESTPKDWRFQVTAVSGRLHALRLRSR